MKRTFKLVQGGACVAIASLVVFTSCKKQSQLPVATTEQQSTTVPKLKSMAIGDTLLNVNYESGTLNSGITGVTATGAPASDAAYMISPGATGSYGIAHKVVFGDSSYYSFDNFRSESDADGVSAARFLPGNIRRYEVSILLKDWPAWDSSQPLSSPVLFQLKQTDGYYVPCQIMAKRNAFVARTVDTTYNTLISNFTPYVNQWVKFRIDVSWTTTNTGYMNIYYQLPGASGYTLAWSKTNVKTYVGPATGGQHGYIKWGVYTGPPTGTRIAYHDDIHIIALN
ncbi:polysaccharide lyase-like protein [Mucilaginibacter yixingensis]|uniref:Polysaccharide lyase-like protein n=1 Tax=Mucilaginibacter yixingensis TaxID=1295612 RepID=A0A2T5J618_9SPHI|nr:heparin lyase I family protein [Mucilaginibacter yixingensis]PTQ93987.1 polysaccharide lyase-like protein [Mucilaginibacter yixingensis]